MGWDDACGSSIMSVIKQYFDQDGLIYRQVDDRELVAEFQGNPLDHQVRVLAYEEMRRAVVYSVVPLRIPPEQRSIVAEYLCRANYGLMLGNFELDFEYGRLRYKTSTNVDGGGELTAAMVKTLLHINLSTADKYAKGLMKVLCSDITPAQAIAEMEGGIAARQLAAQAANN